MTIFLPVRRVSNGDTEVVGIDYTDFLDSGEDLTGTPTAAEQTTSDLTITAVAINSSTAEILNRNVSANKAVTFTVSGGSDTTYNILVTVDTTAGRTIERMVRLKFT